jgi:menaquinone-dependent protoporphyrinogen oxidase
MNDMATLVVFESKYGSTKQYAEWIAQEIGADLRHISEVHSEDLTRYDQVIIGGYLHMGKIIGVHFLLDEWNVLQQKRIVLFTVSGAGPGPAEEKFYTDNVPSYIREKIAHFGLLGRAMDLDMKDRFLVAAPQAMLYLKYLFNRTPENKTAYEGFRPFDGVKEENLTPLLAHLS